PGVPDNVKLSSASSSQLNLTWQKPGDPSGIIRGYVVTWIKVSNDRNEKFNGTLKRRISGGKDTWFVIDNLDPYSVYNVSLNAFTSAGNGPVVNRSDRTNESTPGIPRGLVATNISSTVLNVTWSEPSRRNGILTEYTVYYKLVQYDNNTLVSNPVWKFEQTDLRTVKLSGLEKYSLYEVNVSASTSEGKGIHVTNKYRTDEDVPGPPSNLRCGSPAKKSLDVSWSKPVDPNGVIRSYNVSWKKIRNKDAPDNESGSGSDATEKQSLTNIGNGELEPYTEYIVSVGARTLPELDYGEIVNIPCDTAADVPKTAPLNVIAVRLGPSKAQVRWEEIPKMNWQNSNITYIVKYKRSESTPETTEVKSSELSVELKSLNSNSNYTVYVFARNSVGDGKKSEIASFRTNSCK
ncbi:phosphatidylinositol phosphatase PTPRQ isoform X1, partial [Paramuricea clavata]